MWRADRVEGWRRVWVVAHREIRERGGSRGFLISTVIVVLLVVAGIVLPSMVSGGTSSYHLGVAGDVPAGTVEAVSWQAKAVDIQIKTTTYGTVADGERAVRDKQVDALLVDGSRLEWRRASDSELTALVTNAMQAVNIREQSQRLGISAEQLDQLLVPVTVTSRRIGTISTADDETQTVAMIGILLLFSAITIYGSFVLTGVVQEKSNRVAEVLLARMPAREVLAGKVLGIGSLGLGQFALIAVAAAISVRVVGADAPNVSGSVLAWLVVWFVVGFAFYSVVYAALGALTSRLEDAQSASAPVTYLFIAFFWATLFVQDYPDGVAATLLSFFPPTAPLTMPMRFALGAAPTWQVIASALLTSAAAFALVRVGGRIYSGALLRVGGRVPLREAWRSASS